MCCVVGYVGKDNSRAYILEGLTRLEYRGYDAAGFACLTPRDNRLMAVKTSGDVDQLKKKLQENPIDGLIGVGHTRWSTHGDATNLVNAHPQFDCFERISIVHNGIIENHNEIRLELERQGHIFRSQTDTEIIAHLIESLIDKIDDLPTLIKTVVEKLEGAYAFVCLSEQFPDYLMVARKRSPLCIGVADNATFVSSDPISFAQWTNKVIFLPDQSFALIKNNFFAIYSFDGKEISLTPQTVTINWSGQGKLGYEHFMLKEIYEQKKVIADTVYFCRSISNSFWEQVGLPSQSITKLEDIHLLGCGTSWHAARIAQSFFEEICGMPAQALLASEFRYAPLFPQKNRLYFAISQSGETADTLEAIRLLNNHELPTAVLTNVASSTMVRETQGFLLTQAKQEIAVASTKSFSAQLAALFWLAHRIALHKNLITQQKLQDAEQSLLIVAEELENSIEYYKQAIVTILAPYYSQFKHFIFLGRQSSYPLAQEAALKLKEIAYLFVDCYPGGELKHGPIALIDATAPVVIFSVLDPIVYQKLVSNAQEVKARGGHLLVFAFEGQEELIKLADNSFVFKKVNHLLAPLVMTGVMQFFIYSIAKVLGHPIDKPRNLAKSVTVE